MKCMFGSAAPAPPAEHLMAPCKPSQAFLFQPGHWEGFEEAWSSPSPCAVGMGSPPARSCCQTGGGFGHPWKGHGVRVGMGSLSPKASPSPCTAQSRPVPRSGLSPAPLEVFQAGSSCSRQWEEQRQPPACTGWALPTARALKTGCR